MKKLFITSFILLTLLALTTGSVLADGVVTGMKVSRSGGLTFTFTVTGYLSPSQLSGGYVQVQGGDAFVLHCVQTDEFTVVCHAPAKIDGGVAVALGGSTFWVEKDDMPPFYTGSPKATQYCYNVYDYLSEVEWEEGYWQWMDRGQTCQDAPAAEGDWLWEYSWTFEDWSWFNFYGQGIDDEPCGLGGSCGGYDENWPNPGAGYYLEMTK